MNNQLYNDMYKVISEGDEASVKQYLTDHLNDFPEDFRNQIVMAFFEEALDNEVDSSTAVNEFKSKGLEFIREYAKAKAELEDINKTEEVKSQLGI